MVDTVSSFAYDTFITIINLLLQHDGFFVGHFNIHKNEPFPAQNTLPIWVGALRTKGKITDTKLPELAQKSDAISPTNTHQSWTWDSVRKILRHDQKEVHSYKMQVEWKLKTSELCKSCLILVKPQAQYLWWVMTIVTKTAQLINKTGIHTGYWYS